MPPSTPAWLLLITNLPGRNPTLRMRIWRALKAAGAGLLRDGAYLLPNGERSRQLLEEQGAEIKAAGGLVQLLSFDAQSREQKAELVALLDRSEEYADAIGRLEALKHELSKLAEPEARQRLAAIGREVAAVAARDFFPGEPRKQMEGALADAEAALNGRFAPDEPRVAHRKIRVRDPKDYRARTWATREHLWIDRVASAWLIRRFIDPKARFLWLKRVKDCPKSAVGFDFDGAEFTHVGSKVTFEVLVASFSLEHDAGLTRLGALIHHLDVGGIPIAEGPGFLTIMAGARSLQQDDDALLKAMTPVLESLYAGYAGASAPRSPRRQSC
ncbi:MAG TPA: chromate resistance protein ChrB domain-containing protein [Steroidobacteraceae bacterium]|nr:chromate resistance protein ChrB domain-containing protein [Steroidobacteraceae bacterium]